jgi:hypothetical protein
VGPRNEEKTWHERLVAHFLSVPPFSLLPEATNSPAGPLQLSRRSKGWAAGVARLRWWLILADGPHSGLSFLDPTDDDNPTAVAADEVAREKERLLSVVLEAISRESRQGEEEWIRTVFGDEWILSRLWTRLGHAVRLNKSWLAHLLISTDRWLHKSIRRDREPMPAAEVNVLLQDILQSGTPPDIIGMALLPSPSSC